MKTKIASAPDGSEKRLLFWCPGCAEPHSPRVVHTDGQHPLWTWNGDRERPTLSPSILVIGGQDERCHSFVADGKIQFLSDCTHALAGQTVPLPEWPYAEDTYGGIDPN